MAARNTMRREENSPELPRLSQHWVIVLGVSSLVGVFLSLAVGIPTALVIAAFLHEVMD
ncbi:hypothetical protein OG339_12920 [Streptosporangium sp. NBC_01495]|uniref:hypothetical protein n=1 Tax=Streptosporangium sp. NBC_01495 TaxID=2903899 RepID=UPI002E368A37|nr:hypothetical protein [Streptosporangium sp. NBC_01495]